MNVKKNGSYIYTVPKKIKKLVPGNEDEKVIYGRFIVMETKDGIDKDSLSETMLNHPKFCIYRITTYADKSYLDYWFKLD